MSWNPKKRFSLPKQTVNPAFITVADESELEKCVTQLNTFGDCAKKLHKDAKKYTEFVYAMSQCEKKLSQDFSSSSLCHHDDDLREIAEDYHSVILQSTPTVDEMIVVSQKAMVEPMKKLNLIMNGVQVAWKRREQLIQECQKWQSKVDKLQDKEKTGTNIVKMETNKKCLASAREDLAAHNQLLLREFPMVYAARINYIQPCLEALIRAQVNMYGEQAKLFNDIVKRPEVTTATSDDNYNKTLQQRLTEIRSLSIVAD